MSEEEIRNFEHFKKNLQPFEVEWKIQSKVNGKTLLVPYIDNRAVMNRLDSCFGSEGWSSEIREIDGGFICRITIGDCVREDASDKSDIEPIKGGVSGAMKRTATQWGLGRELYNYPKVYLTGEHKYIPEDVLERLDKLVTAFNEGKLDKKVYVI